MYVNNAYKRRTFITIHYKIDGVEMSSEDISLLPAFTYNSVNYPVLLENEIDRISLVDFQARVAAFIGYYEETKDVTIPDNSRVYDETLCPLPNSSDTPSTQIAKIIPNVRTESSGIGEKNSSFLCPANTVLTGRKHSGDENGTTWYEYTTLKCTDALGNEIYGVITVEDVTWGGWFPEQSGSGYTAPTGKVLVGREHVDDENGATRYAYATVKFNGNAVTLSDQISSANIKESDGIWFKTDSERVMNGRHHSGDENGDTYYNSVKMSSYYYV